MKFDITRRALATAFAAGIAFTALVFGTFAARVLEEQDRQKKKARRGHSDS